MPRPRRTARPVTLPAPRISAWLADIDDWDAPDADVFLATLDRAPRPASRDESAASA